MTNRLKTIKRLQEAEEMIRHLIRCGKYTQLPNGDYKFSMGSYNMIYGAEYVERIRDWESPNE